MKSGFIVALLLWASLPVAAGAASSLTPQQLAGLAFRQEPGAKLPLGVSLVDEEGRKVQLGNFFAGRPVLLVFDYLRCRTLCGFVLGDLASALSHVPLRSGRDFSVVAISIDPRDTPADARAAKSRYLARYGRPGAAGWHFLTGTQAAVRRIADVAGFRYRYDAESREFAHPAGVVVVGADGRIARYILGIGYRPLDLRLALTDAGQGAISSPTADLLLLCFHYDPAKGRYDAPVMTAMRIAGGLTLLGIVAMVAMLSRTKAR
ncbi:MAG TPA: SCO family protein [Stellaceae bacterium]|nr:SCO family protein [Stellaceae bacterium]